MNGGSIRKDIECVISEFNNRPLDFVVEYELQARIMEKIRKRLKKNGKLRAQLNSNGLNGICSAANYKKEYPNDIDTAQDQLSRVHAELAVTNSGGSTEYIDVVVLEDTLGNDIEWNDGSKRFNQCDFYAAIEIKYIKNKNTFPTNSNGNIKPDSNDIESDLYELDGLNTDNTFLVIVSNYDYLYQGKISRNNVTNNTSKTCNDICGHIRDGYNMRKWMENNSVCTDVLYATPFNWSWIV